jgi:hypothetical protein
MQIQYSLLIELLRLSVHPYEMADDTQGTTLRIVGPEPVRQSCCSNARAVGAEAVLVAESLPEGWNSPLMEASLMSTRGSGFLVGGL